MTDIPHQKLSFAGSIRSEEGFEGASNHIVSTKSKLHRVQERIKPSSDLDTEKQFNQIAKTHSASDSLIPFDDNASQATSVSSTSRSLRTSGNFSSAASSTQVPPKSKQVRGSVVARKCTIFEVDSEVNEYLEDAAQNNINNESSTSLSRVNRGVKKKGSVRANTSSTLNSSFRAGGGAGKVVPSKPKGSVVDFVQHKHTSNTLKGTKGLGKNKSVQNLLKDGDHESQHPGSPKGVLKKSDSRNAEFEFSEVDASLAQYNLSNEEGEAEVKKFEKKFHL